MNLEFGVTCLILNGALAVRMFLRFDFTPKSLFYEVAQRSSTFRILLSLRIFRYAVWCQYTRCCKIPLSIGKVGAILFQGLMCSQPLDTLKHHLSASYFCTIGTQKQNKIKTQKEQNEMKNISFHHEKRLQTLRIGI